METNLNYQRRLAHTLVTGLGIEAAMDFARRNDWDGVLARMCATGAADGAQDGGQANGRLRKRRGKAGSRPGIS